MSAIGELDESNATLRLLIILSNVNKPIMLSDLYEEMKSKYGQGRRKVDTALQTCIRLDLIKRETKRIGKNPMPSIFHTLTPKGKRVAEVLIKLDQVLR